MFCVEPFISVVIPSYNRSEFIDRAVRSVLSQTFENLEVLVVDDGSTDDTLLTLQQLQWKNSRLKVIQHKSNLGAQAARNTGIRASRAPYVAFLDSDDEWLPDKLEKQIALLHFSNDGAGVVYTGFTKVYEDNRPVAVQIPRSRGDIYKIALREWIAGMNTLVVRKDILYQAGLMDERIRSYQEWDLCIRLAKVSRFDFINEPLAVYNIHNKPTISNDLMLDALGYLDVITFHRDEIIQQLGKSAFIRHLLSASLRFAQANDFKTARKLLSDSFKLSSFDQILRLTAYWILLHIGRAPYRITTLIFIKIRFYFRHIRSRAPFENHSKKDWL